LRTNTDEVLEEMLALAEQIAAGVTPSSAHGRELAAMLLQLDKWLVNGEGRAGLDGSWVCRLCLEPLRPRPHRSPNFARDLRGRPSAQMGG